MRSGVLARNEYIKARRRPAVWVTLGVFTGLMSLIFGGMFFDGIRHPARPFTLPMGWGNALGGPGVLSSFFASILLILLVSNEYTWRTARQNVIDGLSKEEFFVAKLILLPVLVIAFFAALLLVAGGFGLAGTLTVGVKEAMVRSSDLTLMGGALLGLIGWAAFAFLLAIAVRSSGAAIGAFFLYFIAEQIVGSLAARIGPTVAVGVHFLPMATFKSLWEPIYYGVVALKPGQTLPVQLPMLVLAGALYTVAFLVIAFAIYRRRDL